MKTADVVIVGGGIVGASVAFHLAAAGCTQVVVVERAARLGAGSTGRATGGVRAQFATPINVRMSLYSIDFFATRFAEATGHSAGYKAAGYLFVATNEQHLAYLAETGETQRAEGLTNVERLSAADIAALVPQLQTDDVRGGSFCPTDGFLSPTGALHGFISQARELGVEVWFDTTLHGIDIDDAGAVAGVETSRGRVATRAVVNAAGAWAAEVARLAGVDLPVTPLRRQIVGVRAPVAFPAHLPMVIDMTDGFHFRPQAGGDADQLLLAWPDPAEMPGFDTDFDPSFIPQIIERATARVPCLARAQIDSPACRAGLYEVTPDHHAIICEAPNAPGLFLANGFSGHGVMHSPATGLIVSEMILHGGSRTFDVSQLSLERFAAGNLLAETAVL